MFNKSLSRVKPEFTNKFVNWADQNLKSSYTYEDHDEYSLGYICFDNDEDATLFKLTWEYQK